MANTKIENELLNLEKRYWHAIQSKDVETAIELTDFPCLVTSAQGMGRVDEPSFARMMHNAKYTIDKVEIENDAQVRMLRDDVAVLAYKVHEEVTVDGEHTTVDATDSSTWIRRDGRWLCALHSEAILGDPFGRDKAVKEPHEKKKPNGEHKASDDHAIRNLVATWMAAAEQGDVDRLLSLMAEDVVFMTPGREPFGKQEFEARMREMHGHQIEGKSRIEEVCVLGDWAWCRTHLTISITAPDAPPRRRSGYTLSVLRKNGKGQWQIARDANLLL